MFFQDIGVFMRLNRCHIKSSISYCGIIDPGRFNQPLTNLKNHDILSFPPRPKKPKTKLILLPNNYKALPPLNMLRHRREARWASAARPGCLFHFHPPRPTRGSRAETRGGFKILKFTVSCITLSDEL